MPFIPHLAPATLQPNVSASVKPWPFDLEKINAALNVSPAAKVSIICPSSSFGGKAGEECSIPFAAKATAPSSPQAQMISDLKINEVML